MAEDIKQEMNTTPACIPTKWTRTTVADGDWLQENTIKPLSSRDNFLADKLSAASVDLDALSAAIDTVSSISDTKDTFLSGSIDYVSATLDSFSAKVETSAKSLYDSISAERDARLRGDEDLQAKINVLEAANDVIMVYGTHEEFVAGSASLHLTDKDVIKVLFDDTVSSNQVYYEYTLSTNSWDKIGELDPYYSKAEIDELEEQLSATIANTYLSAKGAVLTGKNIVITEDSNNPKITIATKDNVTFDGVSSTTLSATTAYGSSAKFTNISASNISANLFKSDLGTVDTYNLKFISAIGDTFTTNEANVIQLTARTLYGQSYNSNVDSLIGSAENGKDAYDKVSTAYWSAYKDSTHSGSGKLSANFSISAGENLDMDISDNIIKLNGKPAGVIHDDNLSGLGVQGDLLGLNSAVKIYVPFIANQNKSSAFVEIGNTPVPSNLGYYNEGFAVYRNHTYEVHEGTKTADLGTTINFTGMVVTHSADAIGGFSHYSKYGDVFDLNYNGGDYWLKHLWLNKNGLNFTDNGNINYSANLNFVNLKFYDNQNNIPGTNTKYESQYVNASSIYKWNNTSDIVTQSATLSAGFGIQFTSAATTAMGIKLDATINADDKIAAIGGKELVGGNDVKIVGLISGTHIDPYEYSGNITSISAFRTAGVMEVETQGIVYSFKDNQGTNHSFYSIFVPSADSDSVQYLATSGGGGSRDYYWKDITLPSNYVQSSPANLTIVVGSTGTDLNTLYIY